MGTRSGGVAAFPVSVKGVVVRGGRVLLLRNERDEWELPGGKLEAGEDPAACVVREIGEEVGWDVTVGPVLDVWLYHIRQVARDVLVVTYGCWTEATTAPVRSDEHLEVGLFTEAEVPTLAMPDGYRRPIATWFERLRGEAGAASGASGASGAGRVR